VSPVTVDFTTVDASAVAPADYAAQSATLTFGPTDVTRTITVAVVGETCFEPTEIFFVNLFNSTGGATISDSSGTGTIQNDDSQPTVSINDVSLPEGSSGGTTSFDFTVSLRTPAR
jgi:hypothetical protein